jgi:hypothetical protein
LYFYGQISFLNKLNKMTIEQHKNYVLEEIIADTHNDKEVNAAWYQFFAENLTFPITVVAKLKRRTGEWEDEEIQLLEVGSEPNENLTFGFIITMKGYVFQISLAQLAGGSDTPEEDLEKLNHWLAWKDLPLLENIEL